MRGFQRPLKALVRLAVPIAIVAAIQTTKVKAAVDPCTALDERFETYAEYSGQQGCLLGYAEAYCQFFDGGDYVINEDPDENGLNWCACCGPKEI